MKIILISTSRAMGDEPALVTKMFEDGLMTFHLRKPQFTTQEMRDYIEQIPKHFHNRIVVHSHHILAAKYNLKGVHFTGVHLHRKWKYFFTRLRLRMTFGKLVKTRSYRRLNDIHKEEEYDFDYYFLGTIFNSLTGELYGGYYDEALRAGIKNTPKKLVARGGITDKTIEKAKNYGFYGIALGSFIWKSEDPCGQFFKILSKYRDLGLDVQ